MLKRTIIVLSVALTAFIWIFFARCNEKNKETITPTKPVDSIAIKKIEQERLILDSICLERGHIFEVVNNRSASKTGFHTTIGQSSIYIGDLYNYSPEDTTKFRLIDSPDSSYIVRDQSSIFKKCYRCGNHIEFPKPPTYIKTIWKRKN